MLNIKESRLYKKLVILKKYFVSRIKQRKKLNSLIKRGGPYKVFFLALDASVWKYDSLYRLMELDDNFIPVVLVCPIVNKGEENMHLKLNECYSYMKTRGYNVLCSYDKENQTYINLHELEPDIIFYTNPYRWLIDDRYFINKFMDHLTCYVPYAFTNISMDWGYALQMHYTVWRFYIECKENLPYVKKYPPYLAGNCKVVGYPLFDSFKTYKTDSSIWKFNNKIKIIWAPHHSIEGYNLDLSYSRFLEFADVMLEIADNYKEVIEIIFKPHPLLKNNLYNHIKWGKRKTDIYFKEWETRENTSIFNGDNINLFLTSDAMIHDCGSFLIEYLYTKKPVMLLDKNQIHKQQLNLIADQAYGCHYIGESTKDVIDFIEKVLINKNDILLDKRKLFYNKIKIDDESSVANSIIKDIKHQLNIND